MSRSAYDSRCLAAVAAALGLLACDVEPPTYQFGFNVTGIDFELYSEDVGVYPSLDVLLDPNNPFVDYPVSSKTKWDLFAAGGNAAAFYAWASLLATQPNGEHQYYTALKLRDLYEANEGGADNPKLLPMAIRGFEQVLESFPDSVTYDPTGTIAYALPTFAYLQIAELGGQLPPDWVLVEDANGNPQAVRR